MTANQEKCPDLSLEVARVEELVLFLHELLMETIVIEENLASESQARGVGWILHDLAAAARVINERIPHGRKLRPLPECEL